MMTSSGGVGGGVGRRGGRSDAGRAGPGRGSRRTRRGADILLTSIAAVSWAFLAMGAVAALGLKLLGADGTG
ncbi:hypothetical protein ADK38_14265, partial [Streptomyces varsoviensis]